MIIKPFNTTERQRDLDELNTLLALPYVHADTKQQIDREIRNIQSGLKGESEAAYNIDFHYGETKNWAIIHDLRLEYNGYVAQIDHLLIDRFLEIYVCESKRFSEGIAINQHGEFAAYYQGKPYGIPSPIEQNNRHMTLLKRIFDNDEMELPMRLGLKMKPSLHSLILLGNNAMIRRPQNTKNVDDLDRIIKNEQLKKRINKDTDDMRPSVLLHQFASASKIIFPETLQEFAENLAALHKPHHIDWKARFGIAEPQSEIIAPPIQSQPESTSSQPPRLFCAACKKTVTQKVAQYCWQNKTRFGGRVYCFDCQKNVNQAT